MELPATNRLPSIVLLAMMILLPRIAAGQMVETLTTTLDASGGVSADVNGNIYVADFGITLGNANGTNVYRVLRDGSFSVFATGLEGASGNEFDSEGNLVQSNIAAGKISKIDTAGNVTDFADLNIFSPVGISVGAGDTVFIADCRTPGTIVKATPDGDSDIFASSNLLACPNGLTMDDDGNLYTCNFGNGWVLKITPDGTVSSFVEIPGGQNGHITFANDKLYVVARCANQIYEVDLDGSSRLLAGSGARGNDDGDALDATFNIPNGIAPSPDGDTLYINDAVSLNGDCITTLLNPVVVRMITGVNTPTSVQNPEEEIPVSLSLLQNFPNPFNPTTEIGYQTNETGRVVLRIFDVMGQVLATLVDGDRTPGEYSATWDASGHSSGVYFYRLEAGGTIQTRKMILQR